MDLGRFDDGAKTKFLCGMRAGLERLGGGGWFKYGGKWLCDTQIKPGICQKNDND
jgi:hypothetical protein